MSETNQEARITALSAMLKALLTSLVIRGTLNKADIAVLIDESLAMTPGAPGVKSELMTFRKELPAYLREAMGPIPDEDDHDH
jgi:hypothetical protein